MSYAPGLHVRLGDDLCQVAYRSPSEVARMLVGRHPSDVPDILSRLFAICPSAQQLAGEAAIEAATYGHDRQDRTMAMRAVRLESIREHGLRILLSWPAAIGEAPDRENAAKLNAWSRNGGVSKLEGLLSQCVFGGSPANWLKMTDARAIEAWADGNKADGPPTIASRFLAQAHSITAQAVHERSLLSRHYANPVFSGPRWQGIAAFHLARLIDLAMLIDNLDAPSLACPMPNVEQISPGTGRALVATSRGALEHIVTHDGERVSSYAITSPTDVAFAHGGFARRWIESIAHQAGHQSAPDVRAVLDGLDPCVDARVEVV